MYRRMKRKGVFIDTSSFIALNHSGDQHYQSAAFIASQLNGFAFILSDAVITETYNILRYRLSYEVAQRFLQEVIDSGDYEIADVNMATRGEAVLILDKYREHKISYCDALSTAVMREQQIQHIFAFDHHFEMMGVKLINHLFI